MLPRAPGLAGSILGDAALAPINSFETGEGRGGKEGGGGGGKFQVPLAPA